MFFLNFVYPSWVDIAFFTISVAMWVAMCFPRFEEGFKDLFSKFPTGHVVAANLVATVLLVAYGHFLAAFFLLAIITTYVVESQYKQEAA